MSEPEVERRETATTDFGMFERHEDYDDYDRMATSYFCFSGAIGQQPIEGKQRSLGSPEDGVGCEDVLGAKELNLTTPVDGVKSEKQVEGTTVGTRSQYHSIQQLSQSGSTRENFARTATSRLIGEAHAVKGQRRRGRRRADDDDCSTRESFDSETRQIHGQKWLGCGHPRYPVDLAADGWEGEEDTQRVLRNLFRYYDLSSAAENRMYRYESGANNSDEVSSDVGGRTSNSDHDLRESASDEDLDEGATEMQMLPQSVSAAPLRCDERQAKRARVEHIVSNIRTPSSGEDLTAPGSSGRLSSVEMSAGDSRRRSKRKQTVPQQHDSGTENHHHHRSVQYISDLSDDDVQRRTPSPADDDEDDDISKALCHQFQMVQSRLEDVYARYARSLHTVGSHGQGPRTSDDRGTKSISGDAERLTGRLKAEVRDMVDGLVEGIVRQFVTKYFPEPQRSTMSPQLTLSTDDPPQIDRVGTRMPPATLLPAFSPPPLFPPFLFPVGGDVMTLREIYAKRCAYIDSIMQRARAASRPEEDGAAFNLVSTSGPPSSVAVTSSPKETVDHCSRMSVMSPRCLLGDQLIQPTRAQDPFVTPANSTGSPTRSAPAGPQKKKRTKVTDTRLSPRVARALLQDGLCHHSKVSMDLLSRRMHSQQQQQQQNSQHPPGPTDLSMRSAICTSSVGPVMYGHDLQQQQLAGNLLRHHHPHPHQFQQQRASTVRDTFQPGCHDNSEAIPQFDAAGCRQMSSESAAKRTSLPCAHQRHPGTSFAATSDRACVDRYDYVLLGYDQFAKISLPSYDVY